jgi:hypothetical protein
MSNTLEGLIMTTEEQVQMFLLAAGEFYPFAACINRENRIKPIGVYLENDNPSSLEVVAILEINIREGMENGDYKMAVLAIDVTIKEENVDFDAVELRIFDMNNQEYTRYVKYQTFGSHIKFD